MIIIQFQDYTLVQKSSLALSKEKTSSLCLPVASAFWRFLASTYGPGPYGPEPLGPYGPGPFII